MKSMTISVLERLFCDKFAVLVYIKIDAADIDLKAVKVGEAH